MMIRAGRPHPAAGGDSPVAATRRPGSPGDSPDIRMTRIVRFWHDHVTPSLITRICQLEAWQLLQDNIWNPDTLDNFENPSKMFVPVHTE
jgi:hypothetical protein